MIQQIRKKYPLKILYIIYIFTFNDLSLRNTSKAISRFVTRSYTAAIRDWIQKYKSERLSYSKIKTFEFIIDEIQIKVGSEIIWL